MTDSALRTRLLAELRGTDLEQQYEALQAFLLMHDVPAIVEATRLAHPALRSCALRALGRLAGAGVVRALLRAAFAADIEVRHSATAALAGHPGAITRVVLHHLTRDESLQVRLQAVHSLATIGDRRMLESILRRSDEDESVRQTARQLLGDSSLPGNG